MHSVAGLTPGPRCFRDANERCIVYTARVSAPSSVSSPYSNAVGAPIDRKPNCMRSKYTSFISHSVHVPSTEVIETLSRYSNNIRISVHRTPNSAKAPPVPFQLKDSSRRYATMVQRPAT